MPRPLSETTIRRKRVRARLIPALIAGFASCLVPTAALHSQLPDPGGEVERVADDIHRWRSANVDRQGRPGRVERAPESRLVEWEEALERSTGGTAADEWTRRILLELLVQSRATDPCADAVPGMPVGAQCWSGWVRRMTSLELSAEEVFDLGVRMRATLEPRITELARTHLGLDSPLAARRRLTESAEWRFPSPEAMRTESERYLRAAEERMHTVVHRVPSDPVEVVEMPEAQGRSFAAAAFYSGPRGDQPARYFVNTSQWRGRNRTTAATAAFHEGWPGHHYQQALHRDFDRHPALEGLAAQGFIEGWGLYSELLADEMGLYPSPEYRIGYLLHIQDAVLALQIDTGLHVLGWSREMAVDTMMSVGGRPRAQAELYVDRHLNTPGQTVTYVLGYNEILGLRTEAREALGERFDIRDFHQALMSVGPAPLRVVREVVRAWIRESRPAGSTRLHSGRVSPTKNPPPA